MTHSAHDVAALLIQEQHAAGLSIDKMQLQKYLYLVQGANLEFWAESAFREPLLAYRNGPVVKVVEQTYRDAAPGREPISAPRGGDPSGLPFEIVETVRTVLRHFGKWTGPDLESYVKRPGSPWRTARGALPSWAPSKQEIPIPTIAAWFRKTGVDPAPSKVEPWEATDEERELADQRRRSHDAQSVLAPFEMTPALQQAAERAIEAARAAKSQNRS
ncbi:MAG: hypothetical protein JWO37_1470 [Acidimicrobiales bacterium]|jgi:uncharacterized phage-associated protein|nr:hypothetical protein [Acidimicrobiales bacterium]